ncbi:MAG: hypothetical protein M1453_00380 [Acidobacteria bacterium]|nr:hypothetical protein [Acidobacteriota bacterium]MCL5286443.1 hypothetical protein [Acidobacteriota bacterium]
MLRTARWVILVSLLGLAGFASDQAEIDLIARKRVFPEMGPGLIALKHDTAARRYLVLSSRSAGVAVYNEDGLRMGAIPPADTSPGTVSSGAKSVSSALQFPSDFDITSDGRLVIADRAANVLRFYDATGVLVQSISTPAPSSVAALPEGEVAVASSAFASPGELSLRLVTVYDKSGRVARSFGDLVELASRRDLNRFLNIGRVSSDPSGALYYAFTFLPEPTARKYDRFGYASLEISITSLDIQPAAQAVRREIKRQDEKVGVPRMKTIINALGVDPATQEFWLALGNVILHLDREGTQLAAYRAYTAEGVRLEPVAILVEPTRLLFACDPLGVFEFPRPDKKNP